MERIGRNGGHEKKMNLEVILRRDFPYNNEHNTNHNNGCAVLDTSEGFVFLDNLLSRGNYDWELESFDMCLHCLHRFDDVLDCKIGIDSLVEQIVCEINRISVHELLHLCGLDEDQVGNCMGKMYRFWPCPKFKEKSEEP